MNILGTWKQAVRVNVAQVIHKTDEVPTSEAMAVCAVFLESLEHPLQEWLATTDGSDESISRLEALLQERQSAMAIELLRSKGVSENMIEHFRHTVVHSISEALLLAGMAAA